jgi:lantibiotic leader peptide-processing serine protease
MRRICVTAVLALVGLAVVGAGSALAAGWKGSKYEYVVVYKKGASLASARLAVRQAGGLLVRENLKVGVATAYSANPNFLANVMSQPSLMGAAHSKPIGFAPMVHPKRGIIERLTARERVNALERVNARAEDRAAAPAAAAEPFAPLLWGNTMIHATDSGSYAIQQGSPDVVVASIDTGVDGSHPDIAPNFDAALSRNFTVDVPLVDGDCSLEPDASCNDPANVDENGHGTHTSGTMAAALNGLGTSGIAPKVTLVNLRAGQDSGYFFLQPSVDALTYAGDNGIDVANMSYFIDPWQFNCAANPADSPAAQLEQRTIIEATNRALNYAYDHGVTLISSLGNSHINMDNPLVDDISPDFPPGAEYHRDIDNSCEDLPTEGDNVISAIALGPSTKKADYSNWGTEDTVLSAPGGWFRDFFGTPLHRTPGNLILSALPLNVGLETGQIDPVTGDPTDAFTLRDCQGSTCAYYQYLQGTSMAGPHIAGVAALIVSGRGHNDSKLGGLTMKPKQVEHWLIKTATDHACPDPPLITYTNEGRPPSFNALCEGTAESNNIWGEGIVDAVAASKK